MKHHATKQNVMSLLLCGMSVLLSVACNDKDEESDPISEKEYLLPAEWSRHEGTWLKWPEQLVLDYEIYEEQVWIESTCALSQGEKVHILANDEYEKERISALLQDISKNGNQGLRLDNVDLLVVPADLADIWLVTTGLYSLRTATVCSGSSTGDSTAGEVNTTGKSATRYRSW